MRDSRARSPIPWFGGKQKLAEDIVGFFPPHDSYVEVFGGGGSVLFTKPSATLEVYNDLNDGLVTFFRVLRDRPLELVPLLELTPYARAEWQHCRETWADPALDEVEKARRWLVVATQSFGGMVARGREGWAAGSRSYGGLPQLAISEQTRPPLDDEQRVELLAELGEPPPVQTRVGEAAWRRQLNAERGPAGWKHETQTGDPSGRHHARGWGGERLGRMHLSRAASNANRVNHIWRFVERLRLVQIENLDWRQCFEKYDHETALFYLDPPYVPSTRRAGGYDHELTQDDHAELVDRILAMRGIAVISGYDHELYKPLADRGGVPAARVRRLGYRRPAEEGPPARSPRRGRLDIAARVDADALPPHGRGERVTLPQQFGVRGAAADTGPGGVHDVDDPVAVAAVGDLVVDSQLPIVEAGPGAAVAERDEVAPLPVVVHAGEPTVADVAAAIRSCRFRYATEAQLQQAIAAALTEHGWPVEREVRLDGHGRIDLLAGRVGVEVKVAGNHRDVDRQCSRYLRSPDLDGLVLVTSRIRHLYVDASLEGKPFAVVTLVGAGL